MALKPGTFTRLSWGLTGISLLVSVVIFAQFAKARGSFESELQSLRQQFDVAQQTVEKLNEDKTRLDADRISAEQNFETKIARLNSENQNLLTEKASLKSQADAANKQKEKLEAEIKSLRGNSAERDKILQSLRAEAARTPSEVKKAFADLELLKAENASLKTTFDALKKKETDALALLAEAKVSAEKAGKEADGLTSELKKAQSEAQSASKSSVAELERAKAERDALKKEVDTLQAVSQKSMLALSKAQSELKASNEELKNSKEELKNLEKLREQSALLEKELESRRADLDRVQDELKLSTEKFSDSDKDKAELLKNIEALKKNALASEKELLLRGAELEKLRPELTKALAASKASEANAVKAAREKEGMAKSLTQLKSRTEGLEQKLKMAVDAQNASNAEVKKTVEQKKAWLKELKTMKARVVAIEKTLKEKEEKEKRLAFKDASKAMESLRQANAKVESLSYEISATHYNLGVLYSRLGQYEDAASELEYALKLKPNDPQTHYNIAVIYDNYLNQPKNALPHYEAYVRLLPRAQDVNAVQQRIVEMSVNQDITQGKDLRRRL